MFGKRYLKYRFPRHDSLRLQEKADIKNREIYVARDSESMLLGAAILAAKV